MPRIITTVTASTLVATLFAGAQVASAGTYGIANYASYRDSNYAAQAARVLEEQLATPVQITEVEIDGATWLRLQSGAIGADKAKRLVERATAEGYQAWYQSAGVSGSVATVVSTANTNGSAVTERQMRTTGSKGIESADPDLVARLPEGPLLGDLYPPRSPLPRESEQ